jgi:hypothetical protein
MEDAPIVAGQVKYCRMKAVSDVHFLAELHVRVEAFVALCGSAEVA